MKEAKLYVSMKMFRDQANKCLNDVNKHLSWVNTLLNGDAAKYFADSLGYESEEVATLACLDKAEASIKELREEVENYFAVVNGNAQVVVDFSLLGAQRNDGTARKDQQGVTSRSSEAP